jgi:proline iminopeptidase
MVQMDYKEGFYTIRDVPIYYKLFESPGATKKLIVLHGGPGATHDADLPLAKLSDRGITVLFYDQYGSGKSGETPDFLSRLTTDYYVEEVEAVRRAAFGDEKVFIMGHSWGGMLGLAYAVKHQDRMRGFISTGGISSVPYYTEEVNKIIEALPPEIRTTIQKYESTGDYNNPEYLKAVDYFYHHHLCRLDKWPEEMSVGMRSIETRKVYKTWWGPNEFRATGALKDWDITEHIRSIKIPTLVTTGRYDEVSPNVAKRINDNVPGSKLVTFENSSHCPMWEEPEPYLRVVDDFIKVH